MKVCIENASRLLATGFLASILAACGGSDSSSDDEHEHEHGSLLISQLNSNSVSIVDEGQLESFEDSLTFTSAMFVRSDNGEFAAIKGGSDIQFADEEGILTTSVTGSEVIASNGHFSILNAGSTTFVEVEGLEDDMLESESTVNLGITETFPALLLDEADDVKLVFVGGEARVYEGEMDMSESFTCNNPSSVAQAHHSAVVTCDEGVTLLQHDEDTMGITYTITALDLDGTESDYVWQATEHVFAGYAPGTVNYALVHIEENGSTETILSSDASSETLASNICVAGIEVEDEDFLFWLDDGNFVALDHEAELINRITVDTSTSTDCSDYNMSTSEKTAFVLDNDAMRFYEIDVDEGLTNYHIHESIEISISDIVDSVVLFHNEEGEHHDHDDE